MFKNLEKIIPAGVAALTLTAGCAGQGKENSVQSFNDYRKNCKEIVAEEYLDSNAKYLLESSHGGTVIVGQSDLIEACVKAGYLQGKFGR